MKNKLIQVLTLTGFGWFAPVVRLAHGENPEEQLRQILFLIGLPVVTFALFLFAWAGASAGIQTNLGRVPGPAQVYEQVKSLAYEHATERQKRVDFYKTQAEKNAVILAADPSAAVKVRKFTGKPTYLDQIGTSLRTVFTGFLIASAFLASAVEFVEALTIVLAAGVSRGWRSALAGLGAATLVLALIVAALGPALTHIPISGLRLFVGALLLTFGLQWLRKAILRASGFKALHDEDAIFARELEEARAARGEQRAGIDWYGFTLAFKGVLLEGLEVAFIVITFGSTQGRIELAALGAGAALVLVAVVGVLVRAPLARVPENTMKFAVGAMLTTFGIFWSTEGAGAHWPGKDAALPALLAFVLLLSFAAVTTLRRRRFALA